MSDTPKRPYERPTLKASDVFGAEATSTGCCRTTACNIGNRSTGQAVDPLKKTSSTAS